MSRMKVIFLLFAAILLSGCNLVVMNPPGDIASQQADLIVYSTLLMCIIIIPVLIMIAWFAYKYRSSNRDAEYDPEWDHSTKIEIFVWGVPVAIIIALAVLTYVFTHRLNPYDPLKRISAEQPIDPSVEPLQVQVVSMDWKWLFIYPEYGVASVNEMAAIVDRPIEFLITSDTVMSAFYVPALSGMIYAMPGMQTELNAVMNAPGTYDGFAANYTGNGYSHQRFDFIGTDQAGFDAWIAQAKESDHKMDRETYVELAHPSEKEPVAYFSGVEDALWDRIINMCAKDDTLCLNDMRMVDALGGGGLEGLYNREVFAGICSANDPGALLAMIRPELKFGDENELLFAAGSDSLLPQPQANPITEN